jgi:aminoglycoside phosphotransferase (APT) family kinase protein
MGDDLRALLIPPQEASLRSRFGLEGVPLRLIASGWHRLVVAAPGRVFVFPRHLAEVPMLEREADVLPALGLDFAPRLLGLHRDDRISPYPFLELTRIPGNSYDAVEASLSFEGVATCLEGLGRRVAQWHRVAVPPRLGFRPGHLDAPRVSGAWTEPDDVPGTVRLAAESLGPHIGDAPADLWAEALLPVAALGRTTVHGEVSDGQFLVDEGLRVTGVVDWGGLHVAHPFVDLDFGVGGYRVCRWEQSWVELRRRIWGAYAAERGVSLPEWRCVDLFWCLLDAMTLLRSGRADARLSRALADLSEATRALRRSGG